MSHAFTSTSLKSGELGTRRCKPEGQVDGKIEKK
jgi:hypothetical protein